MGGAVKPNTMMPQQAALAALLFYAVYLALCIEGLVPFSFSILSIALLVLALLQSGQGDKPRFPLFALLALGSSWLLYVVVTSAEPGGPFVHGWPLPLMASTVLLTSIRHLIALSASALVLASLATQEHSIANFLHNTGLPFITGIILCAYLAHGRINMMQSLQRALGTDRATGCDNKERLCIMLQLLVDAYQRYATPASIIVFEVQRKTEPHAAPADAMLLGLCNVWRSRLRATDKLYRLSDHRFVCVLINTPADKALVVLNDLIKATAHYEIADKHQLLLHSEMTDIARIDSAESALQHLIACQCR